MLLALSGTSMYEKISKGFTTFYIYNYAYSEIILDSYSNYYLVQLYILSKDEVVHAHQHMFSERHGRL
jgi:hypothetical protein